MQYREECIDDLLALLYPQLTKPLGECTVLDMGCGVGALTLPTSWRVKRIKGIDVNEIYIAKCKKRAEEEGVKNAVFEVRSLFEIDEEGQYDIVLCSDVLEHVEDQDGVLKMIYFSLKDDGVFYLTTNNKFWPMEGHFGLPFLSYLPRSWAERYVRWAGRGEVYNIYPLSYGHLVRLLGRYPFDFEFKPPKKPQKFIYRLGTRFVRISPLFWNFSNAFQVIGRKRS